MKILFICSSLEQGYDGVGDYTRRLAAELIKQDNPTAILAINDTYVTQVFTGTQQANTIVVPVMRIPSVLAKGELIATAKGWINEFNPEWISLQFVPFGFHPKGLNFRLGKLLLSFSGERAWHIMFHELWVGMAVEESKKLIWWGRLQRMMIEMLILKLQPKVIHTQTLLYQKQLYKIGFDAEYLPLFGNIPVIQQQDKKRTVSAQDEVPLSRTEISFVVFGSIHEGAPIVQFAEEAAAYSRSRDVVVKLTFIGRCGPEQERWAAIWKSAGLDFDILGEQPVEYISRVLSAATMGISATATAVIEKSGAVAAMREHGLRVLSLSKAWHPGITFKQPEVPGIIIYSKGNFEACVTASLNAPYANSVAAIAYQMANNISNLH